MIKRFSLSKQTSIPHDFGRSFKFDFPIEAIEGYVVGVYACPRNIVIYEGKEAAENENQMKPYRNATIGKISVSTDNGDVIHSAVPVMLKPALDNINKMIVPVDYHQVGNKLTIVAEEFIEDFMEAHLYGYEEPSVHCTIKYDLDVYVKLSKRVSDVTDLNRHREGAFC
jgi:hypothetical protein